MHGKIDKCNVQQTPSPVVQALSEPSRKTNTSVHPNQNHENQISTLRHNTLPLYEPDVSRIPIQCMEINPAPSHIQCISTHPSLRQCMDEKLPHTMYEPHHPLHTMYETLHHTMYGKLSTLKSWCPDWEKSYFNTSSETASKQLFQSMILTFFGSKRPMARFGHV